MTTTRKTTATTIAALAACGAAIALLALAPGIAHATGNHEPPGHTRPNPNPPRCTGHSCNTTVTPPATPATTPVSVTAPSSATGTATATGGRATSGSASGAQSGANSSSGSSVGNTSAAGGQGGAGGSATSSAAGAAAAGDSSASNSLSDQSSTTSNFWSQSRALGLTFAPGAFTPPMAPVQCASATITQSSRGFGMGLASWADSRTDSSDCTLINLRNAMVAACKFESAKQVEDLLVRKHLPDFRPSQVTYLRDQADPGYVDYSPTQCAILTAPPPKPAPVELNLIYAPPAAVSTPPAPPAPVTPPAAAPVEPPAKPKVVKRSKPAATPEFQPCGNDGVLVRQCVPKQSKAPRS